jgi:hypothetical protein
MLSTVTQLAKSLASEDCRLGAGAPEARYSGAYSQSLSPTLILQRGCVDDAMRRVHILNGHGKEEVLIIDGGCTVGVLAVQVATLLGSVDGARVDWL